MVSRKALPLDEPLEEPPELLDLAAALALAPEEVLLLDDGLKPLAQDAINDYKGRNILI